MDFFGDQDFLDNIRQHFVCLSGKYVHLDSAGKQASEPMDFAFSAFIIDVYGVWCLVTAGHVLKDMANFTRADMKLLRCGLGDYFSPNARVKEPTPFPFNDVHKIHVDEDGVDIGLIPLTDFYRDSLKSNDIVPVTTGGWAGREPLECDAYALLGLPEETRISIPASSMRGSGISAQLTIIGLKPVPVPDEFVTSRIPRFCAVWLEDGGLTSVNGMSGGPIFGMRKTQNGRGEYTCIAVQGTEIKGRRMVFGTPITIVLAAIKEQLDEHITKVVRISKVDVARRQIKAATKLFFLEQDPIAIQTLVSSALNIISEIIESRGAEPIICEPGKTGDPAPDPISQQHAFFGSNRGKPDASIDFDPGVAESILVCICSLYGQFTGEQVPLLLCMITWFKFREGKPVFDEQNAEALFFNDLWELYAHGDRPEFLARFMRSSHTEASPDLNQKDGGI